MSGTTVKEQHLFWTRQFRPEKLCKLHSFFKKVQGAVVEMFHFKFDIFKKDYCKPIRQFD